MTREDFIQEVAKYVCKYAAQFNIMVHSPIIAQACLESNFGTSDKVYKDGEWRHNYLGLKWRNGRCAISNDYFEEIGSEQDKNTLEYVTKTYRWCKFKSLEECVIGYFQWTNTSNYSNLKGVTDPRTYLENIKKDNYATSVDYVKNVMNVIEKYNLTQFDNGDGKMSNSSLVNYTKLSPNKSVRTHKIDTITIHCMAGNLSIETCGDLFASVSKRASSNYGIGSDGRIGLYVDEANRSWCSSNAENDNRAVTIEVANDGGAPNWHVSDKALVSLINLCADICKRNGISELKWKANKSLVGNIAEQNMTVHRWFAAKACPGEYLFNKHSYIAEQVNILLGVKPKDTSFKIKVLIDDLNYRDSPSMKGKVKGQTGKGVFTIVEVNGNWGKLKSGVGWVYLANSKYCVRI